MHGTAIPCDHVSHHVDDMLGTSESIIDVEYHHVHGRIRRVVVTKAKGFIGLTDTLASFLPISSFGGSMPPQVEVHLGMLGKGLLEELEPILEQWLNRTNGVMADVTIIVNDDMEVW